MAMRSIGPFNGLLPEPTGVLVGYLRDPKMFPYLQYTQFIAAPDVQFRYWLMNFDEPVRVPRENDFVWAYGDYRPTGKGFSVQGEWVEARTNRWDFPYTIDNETINGVSFTAGTPYAVTKINNNVFSITGSSGTAASTAGWPWPRIIGPQEPM